MTMRHLGQIILAVLGVEGRRYGRLPRKMPIRASL